MTAPPTQEGTDPRPTDNSADRENFPEYRAYLQRGETRLSTLHRVAGAFISGAGLITLLPLLVGGKFSDLLMLIVFYDADDVPPPGSWPRWLALGPMLASITLPLIALYLLVGDLAKFYFTARTFQQKENIIYPRFVLSGIMVHSPSLHNEGDELQLARRDPYVRNLLVPEPQKIKSGIRAEARSVGEKIDADDPELLETYVLRQTSSYERPLAQEVAKMEASLARHLRSLRGLVLRYAKAFLLTIATTVATLAAHAVLTLLRPIGEGSADVVNDEQAWLVGVMIYSMWALASTIIVRRPVRWLYSDSNPSSRKLNRTPPSLLYFERTALAVAVLVSLTAICNVEFSGAPRTIPNTLIIVAVLLTSGVTMCIAIYDFSQNSEWLDGRK